MDVDAAVGTLDRRRAGRGAEETGEAGGGERTGLHQHPFAAAAAAGRAGSRYSQLPDGGLLLLLNLRTLPGRSEGGQKRENASVCHPTASLWSVATHRIISVHRTASCSSISLSLYWFLSISTRAISTRVNLRRCVSVMSPSCCGGSENGGGGGGGVDAAGRPCETPPPLQTQAPLTSSPPSSLESRDAPSASARSLQQKGEGATAITDGDLASISGVSDRSFRQLIGWNINLHPLSPFQDPVRHPR